MTYPDDALERSLKMIDALTLHKVNNINEIYFASFLAKCIKLLISAIQEAESSPEKALKTRIEPMDGNLCINGG